MIFFDDSITKDRADRCVSHHHACDCLEYACRQRIEALEAALSVAIETIDDYADMPVDTSKLQALLPGRGDDE